MKNNKTTLVIGGSLILGLGVGIFFLPNGREVVASLIGGLGLGLILTSFVSKK